VHFLAPNPKGTVLLVHGLFEDNRNIYGYLIGELNKHGYSVHFTTLPYHYERTPPSSAFSGEYFFSADLGRTKGAFCRACAEVYHAYQWLAASSSGPTFVVGFSMGAAVSLAVAALSHVFRGLFVINPAASLTDVMWTSPLCQTLKRDLIDAGHRQRDIEEVLASFDPCFFTHPAMDLARIQMSYALYDQVTSVDQYETLVKRWNLSNVRSYKAGHLNTLRVPRLAEDIATFFNGLSITPTQ
jgi:pimeloyl-ACP methyl ester carboxylesterase